MVIFLQEERNVVIDKKLLDILVCPQCKGRISFNEQENELICHKCNLLYQIEDDIPVMLVDKARKVDTEKSRFSP